MPETRPTDGERVGLLAKVLREEREIQDAAREAIVSATRKIRESEQRIIDHRRGFAAGNAPAPAAEPAPEAPADETPAEQPPAA